MISNQSELRQKSVSLLIASIGIFILGLLTGEAALGGLGYIFAWEMFMVKKPLKDRILGFTPYFLITAIWFILYTAAGFGAKNTGIYHDPSTDPIDFLTAVGSNYPILILGKWIPIPLDFWAITPAEIRYAIIGFALLFTGFLFWMLRPLLQKQSLNRFWAAGMLLSMAPFTATLPMDRLVLFAGLGAAALLGNMACQTPTRKLRRILWKATLILHLPLAALLGIFRSSTLDMVFAANTGGYVQAPSDDKVPEQTFVYVASTFHRVHYTTLMRMADGNPAVPRRSIILSSATAANTITRLDANTLEIIPDGGYMDLLLDQIHRRSKQKFSPGDRISLPDVEIEVTAINEKQHPAKAKFHFHQPLEDPSLRWLVVEPEPGSTFPPVVTTKEWPLPAIGETVTTKSAL